MQTKNSPVFAEGITDQDALAREVVQELTKAELDHVGGGSLPVGGPAEGCPYIVNDI